MSTLVGVATVAILALAVTALCVVLVTIGGPIVCAATLIGIIIGWLATATWFEA